MSTGRALSRVVCAGCALPAARLQQERTCTRAMGPPRLCVSGASRGSSCRHHASTRLRNSWSELRSRIWPPPATWLYGNKPDHRSLISWHVARLMRAQQVAYQALCVCTSLLLHFWCRVKLCQIQKGAQYVSADLRVGQPSRQPAKVKLRSCACATHQGYVLPCLMPQPLVKLVHQEWQQDCILGPAGTLLDQHTVIMATEQTHQ